MISGPDEVMGADGAMGNDESEHLGADDVPPPAEDDPADPGSDGVAENAEAR